MDTLHEFMRHAAPIEYALALAFLVGFWAFWWLLVQGEDR